MQAILHKSRKLLRKIEVDRAVLFGVLSKFWSVFAGPVTALLIVVKFTPEYQGYYYTFASLLALQVFVELGLGTVIIQFASHEWSKLGIDEGGNITGDKDALSRLRSLASITSKWYMVGAAIIALGLSVAGYMFFIKSHNAGVNWVFPWFSLCFLTAVTICFIPVWALLEGCNQVSNVYTYRFFQGIITSLSVWVAIFIGAKLWAASISVVSVLLCSVIFLGFRYRNFIKSLFLRNISGVRIDWRKEIFPMQWRIALSWITGYFVFSLFTPVLFRYHGPIIAGQFGMTWTIIGGIGAIAGSWLSPKIPQFGMLIARKEYQKLDQLFWRITKIFIFIILALSVFVWIAIYVLYQTANPFSQRILPPLPAGLFLIAQIISILSFPFSFYLRAHKKEPLLYFSVLLGVVTGLSTFILGKNFGINGMAFGYLIINIIFIPFVVLIWHNCRRFWHANIDSDKKIFFWIGYIHSKIQNKALFCYIKENVRRLYLIIISNLCGIIAYPFCLLMRIRFLVLLEGAIGHLCVELDCYIKEGILGLHRREKAILLASSAKICNMHFLGYWKRYFTIISSPWLCAILEPLARNRFTGYSSYRFAVSFEAAYFPEIQKRFAGRPALLSLKQDDIVRGWEVLYKMGLKKGDWFVCFHCREDGSFGKPDCSPRNANIENYFSAIESVVSRGGWVIRMGDEAMKSLPPMRQVIDYAHSEFKSDWMDVFLCGSTKFFHGSHSGLSALPSIFGVPVAITNYAHMSGVLPYGVEDICMPKLTWSDKQNRYLHFKEVSLIPLRKIWQDYESLELRLVDNDPEDIKNLTDEMFARIEGKMVYTEEDNILQQRFKSLMNPSHFSYGSVSRIGRDFLRKYSYLVL
ncbi:MAG: TIGR04372 family glycosyltransferase [Candidatus Omnitrophica bacterium]|nr:TIGR04372 family glycosyltransferase [Candidatus Omnitrophota bacterium]